MLRTKIMIESVKLISQLFENDISIVNKIKLTYVVIENACKARLFYTIPMGYIYVMVIAGAFAPLLGTKIGEVINYYTGKEK